MAQKEQVMEYVDLLRGVVSPYATLQATMLLYEVQKELANIGTVNQDLAYETLVAVADSMGIENPFKDKERFWLAYEGAKQLAPVDWEEMIKIEEMDYSRGHISAPKALMNLYAERLSDGPGTVLIAEAEKFVPYLYQVISAHPQLNFVLSVQNKTYATALEYVFEQDSNVEIIVASIYQYEFLQRKFDFIFSIPAFGKRARTKEEYSMCKEMELVALENLSLHLQDGGRLIITLPSRIAFAPGEISAFRQFIQANYTIWEISELPEGIFERSKIRTYLLDIENKRPNDDDDIIICRYSTGEKKDRQLSVESLDAVDDTFVMLEELEARGDWNIDRIFSEQDEEYSKFQKSNIRKEMLGNVAQVFRGKAVPRKDSTGSIGVVNISNIGDYELNYTDLAHIQEDERKVRNYLLQEGDVLLPARGTAIRTAVFHEQDYPCIASANVITIRPNGELLDSTYLKIFLDSSVGHKLIIGVQQGTNVMNISYTDLRALEIPVPPISEQREKAQIYSTGLENYRDAISKAEGQWNTVLTELQDF